MNANRIADALDRIAAAVDRIDRARAMDGDATLGLRLTQLGARHDTLRKETETALASLDDIISVLSEGRDAHG